MFLAQVQCRAQLTNACVGTQPDIMPDKVQFRVDSARPNAFGMPVIPATSVADCVSILNSLSHSRQATNWFVA
jgi:hypothetical protein